MRNRGVDDSSVSAILVDGNGLQGQGMGCRPGQRARWHHCRSHALPMGQTLWDALPAATAAHTVQRSLVPTRHRHFLHHPLACGLFRASKATLLCPELCPRYRDPASTNSVASVPYAVPQRYSSPSTASPPRHLHVSTPTIGPRGDNATCCRRTLSSA